MLTVHTVVMIAVRIIAVARRTAPTRLKKKSRHVHSAVRIIVESGLLYTATTAIQLGVAVGRNPMLYPVGDCVRIAPCSRLSSSLI
jgi:hypothetical protein